MSKKKKVVSTVIIPKLPADARRNLAKLERHMERRKNNMVKVSPLAKRMDRRDSDAKILKAIYESEGADACLGLCRKFKQTRREMLLLLAAFEAKK